MSLIFLFLYLLRHSYHIQFGESNTEIEFKVYFSLFPVNIILPSPNIGFSGEMRYREGNVSRENSKKKDY